ncbi:MAG: serine hydrolase domain-containing protein [Pseudohongiellaceae bacterium]
MRIKNTKMVGFIIGGIVCLSAALILTSGNSEVKTDVEVSQSMEQAPITDFQKNEILDSIKRFPNNTQFAIALVQGDETQFIGIERKDDRVYPISNRNSAFEIGSITKVFTATLLADFVLSNTVAIEEDVNAYLPLQLNNDINLNFLHLANHTSGMPRWPENIGFLSLISPSNPYKYYDEVDFYNYLSNDLEIQSGAGVQFRYSNLGMSLVGVTLSEIANQSYEDLLQDRLLKPYKMENSTTQRNSLNVAMVQGLDKEGDKTSNWDLNILAPSGGLFSTVDDLSQFVRAHFNLDDNLLAFTRKLTSDKGPSIGYRTLGMGLGWIILQPDDTETWYWHNGGTGGYSSSMVINVEKRQGVIVLSNVSAFNDQSARVMRLGFSLINSF